MTLSKTLIIFIVFHINLVMTTQIEESSGYMKVWYVSYGSNMDYDRFSSYITGGKSELMTRSELGCRDKSLPVNYGVITLNKKMKFIESSDRWFGGGVAVISVDDIPNEKIYGVKYLIEADQFIDIIKQENNIELSKSINLDIANLKSNITKVLFEKKRYSQLIYLGEYEGYKAYSFTCTVDRFQKDSKKPHPLYLKNILSGLKKHLNNSVTITDIVTKYQNIEGIKGNYSSSEINEILSI